MQEISAVVAFIVLVGLLIPRMIREGRAQATCSNLTNLRPDGHELIAIRETADARS